MPALGVVGDVLKRVVGNTTYYFGTVGSDKVKGITFVPVIKEESAQTFLSENTDNGYQRPGSLARMKAFRNFLKKNPDHVSPPVLLSGRNGWTYETDGQGHGRLVVDEPAAIIDGQHRVGGFVALHEEDGEVRDVPFILLSGLTRQQEVDTFLVVNNSQKGVPKALSAYLYDKDEAQVAWNLNALDDSPFKDRIARTRMERTMLFQLHSVAKEIKKLFSVGALQELEVDVKTEFAIRFFDEVADALPAEWDDIEQLADEASRGRADFQYKLLELTGLIAWCHVGAQILSRSYDENTGMNWDNVRRLVQAASKIDWTKTGQYQGRTGTVGGKIMGDDMVRLLPAEAAE